MAFDPLFVYANYVECGLWAGLGAVTLIKGKGSARLVLAGMLVAFGISDLVETRTGAWYRPWWLFAWKAICVLGILVVGIAMVRKRPAD